MAQDNPEILTLIRSADDLTPEGIEKNPRLESILGVHLWFNLLFADHLIPEARSMVEKNPDFAKEIDDPVILLLIQHPEIQPALEQYGRDAMLGQLREDRLHQEAFEALYREKDKGKAARLLAEWFREREKAARSRNTTSKTFLTEVMRKNPGVVIYVWRGTHHEGFDAGIDYGVLRFERSSRPAPEDFELISAVLARPENASLRDALLNGKTDPASFPLFRNLTEGHSPWAALQVALRSSGRVKDTQQAYRLAMEMVERVRLDGHLPELTERLQSQAGSIFTEKAELFEDRLPRIIPPTLSFLREKGYLTDEVEALLPSGSSAQRRSAPRNPQRTAILNAMLRLRSLVQQRIPSGPHGIPPRVAVVGPSLHRDRIPLLRSVLEGVLEEAAWQVFFDSGEPADRSAWARELEERYLGMSLPTVFFGTEAEFQDFVRFASGYLWEIRPYRTPIRDPARLVIRLLRTIGRLDEGILAEEGRQIRRALDLLLNA